jgi:hypothetical protein
MRPLKEAARFRHAPADDPLEGTAAGGLGQRARDVGWAAVHRRGHVAQRQAFQAIALDEAQAIDHDALADDGTLLMARGLIDLVQDQREEAVSNRIAARVRAGLLTKSLELLKQSQQELLAFAGDAHHRRGSVAHALERFEQPGRAVRRKAGRTERETPVSRVLRVESSMGLTRRNQQHVTRT